MTRWQRAALAAIVAGSAALTLVWVFLVPVFQAADEPTHFDYALDLHAHRGLFRQQHDTIHLHIFECREPDAVSSEVLGLAQFFFA